MKFSFLKEEKYSSQYALEGEVLRRKGNYKKALDCFNKAIELEPNNDMYFSSRSKAKFELKDLKGAIEDIDTAIKIQPTVNEYAILKEKYNLLLEKK